MEYDTLIETDEKLPKFADQLGVTVSELRRILNRNWLPNIEVVRLPPTLRELDPRALLVRDRDADDFPAATLAALLSPCLLLTHDKDFGVLGVRSRNQGGDGVLAVIDIKVGEVRLQAVMAVPAIPFRAAGAAMNWATKKIGPAAWVIVGLVVAGGIHWYLKQPTERRDGIKKVAASIGTHVMNEYGTVAGDVYQARVTLRASVVPKPVSRTSASAIVRELALSPESLSAAQLAELLDPWARLPVTEIRAFLRENDNATFHQVRRGGLCAGDALPADRLKFSNLGPRTASVQQGSTATRTETSRLRRTSMERPGLCLGRPAGRTPGPSPEAR
jgi:hypothetical protein